MRTKCTISVISLHERGMTIKQFNQSINKTYGCTMLYHQIFSMSFQTDLTALSLKWCDKVNWINLFQVLIFKLIREPPIMLQKQFSAILNTGRGDTDDIRNRKYVFRAILQNTATWRPFRGIQHCATGVDLKNYIQVQLRNYEKKKSFFYWSWNHD